MVDEVRADRSEQRTSQSPAGTSTDDEEIGVSGNQAIMRRATQHVASDGHRLFSRERSDSSEFVANKRAGAGVVLGFDQPGFDRGGGGLPGVDEGDGVTGAGMLDGPSGGGVRCDRAVDPDDDSFGLMVRLGVHVHS